MTTRSRGRRAPRALCLSGIAVLLLGLLAPAIASAHPLDVELQASYLTLGAGAVTVEIDDSPGVLVAPQALARIDADGDSAISAAESSAYARALVDGVALRIDGVAVTLTVTKVEMPTFVTIQAGYGVVRVFATGSPSSFGASGSHHIDYTNQNVPAGVSYQVNTFVENGSAISLGTQDRTDTQQALSLDVTVGLGTSVSPGAAQASSVTLGQGSTLAGLGPVQDLVNAFSAPSLGFGAIIAALGFAMILGALHALTPGHGKTLAAAYLVGSRGTVRHAVSLGAVVTITHTVSVIAFGVVALAASQLLVPGILVPSLEVGSGVLVVLLGGQLLWRRSVAVRHRLTAHGDAEGHGDPHSHDHGHDHPHVHAVVPDRLTMRGLVAMGISGGVIPCPEALGILVVAVGLNRIGLGLGLIVAFGIGIAVVLIAVGILLVRARGLVDRLGGETSRLSRAIPLVSAAFVTVLGAWMTVSGLGAWLAR